MCIQCHETISKEEAEKIVKVLTDRERQEFEKWNTTSINHTFIMALGLHGPIVRKGAIESIKMFIEWQEKTKNGKHYYSCLDWFQDAQYYREKVECIEQFYAEHDIHEEVVRKYIYHGETNEEFQILVQQLEELDEKKFIDYRLLSTKQISETEYICRII